MDYALIESRRLLERPDFLEVPGSNLSITTILYMDDDYVNYLYLKELLNEAGVEVCRTVSIEQTFHTLLSRVDIGLVMYSVDFARQSNYSIVSSLRNKFNDIAQIVIVNKEADSTIEFILNRGCDTYLNIPGDSDQIKEVVFSLIEN